MRIESCTIYHIASIRCRTREKGVAGDPAFMEWARHCLDNGTAVAGVNDQGIVLCCGGVTIHHEGLGEAWVLFSPDMVNHKLQAFKLAKQVLELHSGLRRIQAHIRADDETAIRFIERLGFEREGRLRQFGADGSDYYMYARVKGEE